MADSKDWDPHSPLVPSDTVRHTFEGAQSSDAQVSSRGESLERPRTGEAELREQEDSNACGVMSEPFNTSCEPSLIAINDCNSPHSTLVHRRLSQHETGDGDHGDVSTDTGISHENQRARERPADSFTTANMSSLATRPPSDPQRAPSANTEPGEEAQRIMKQRPRAPNTSWLKRVPSVSYPPPDDAPPTVHQNMFGSTTEATQPMAGTTVPVAAAGEPLTPSLITTTPRHRRVKFNEAATPPLMGNTIAHPAPYRDGQVEGLGSIFGRTSPTEMESDSEKRGDGDDSATAADGDVLQHKLSSDHLLGEGGADRQGSTAFQLRARTRQLFLQPTLHSRSPSKMSSGTTPRSATSKNTTTSPFRVDSDVFDVSFSNKTKVESSHRGNVYHVWQTRDGQGKYAFDQQFLPVRINDSVVIHWFNPRYGVYETVGDYENVIPGGQHSKLTNGSNAAGKGTGGAVDFTVQFTSPGDYYFVCSRNKRRMRLHVQVKDREPNPALCGILTLLGVVPLICAIVAIVVSLTVWFQKKDLFVSRENALSEQFYYAMRRLQKIVTLYFFPWFATGVLIIIFLLLIVIGWSIRKCCVPPRQGSLHRGVTKSWRRFIIIGTIVFSFVSVALIFVSYGLQLDIADGASDFLLQLSRSILATTNGFSTALEEVQWLVAQAPSIFPEVSVPYDKISDVTDEITSIINQTHSWTGAANDIAQGTVRVLPTLLFLTSQLGLFAAALGVGTFILRFRSASSAAAWIFAFSIGCYACAVGVVWAYTKIVSEVHSGASLFKRTPEGFLDEWGVNEEGIVSQLFSACQLTAVDVQFIGGYIRTLVETVNETLDSDKQEQLTDLFDKIFPSIPLSFDLLTNYTSYALANLNIMEEILGTRGDEIDKLANRNVATFLKVLLSAIRKLSGVVNCQIFRQILGDALPVLKRRVQYYNVGLLVVILIAFVLSFITVAFAAGSAYSQSHPRKIWYDARTGRWFRFRYSYKVYQTVLAESPRRRRQTVSWRTHLRRKFQPQMHQVLTTKLVCYAASVLMFFDSIILALYSNFSRTVANIPMLRTLCYLGCVQLIFLLGTGLFSQVWARRVTRGVAVLIVFAYTGVAIAQTIVGFYYFGDCMQDPNHMLDVGRTVGLSPSSDYSSCSVEDTGHQLEIAVYATISFFNGITVLVTLVLLFLNERMLTVAYQVRPYVGVLSPLQARFPQLQTLFRNQLNVRRVIVGVFILIIVLFLILIAVIDGASFRFISGGPLFDDTEQQITQVINPIIGCNGDPRYCDLRVNEIVWATAHNAHSSLEDDFVVPNHYYNISRQLDAGVRGFMIDLWYDTVNSTESDAQDVYVCHSICFVGRQPFRSTAVAFKKFLDTYPTQVLMVIIEQYVQSNDIGKIMDEVGLTKYVWYNTQEPPNKNPNYEWPTLREMIRSDQRIMMFSDVDALNNLTKDGTPPWLYYNYDYQYENAYQFSSVDEWSCEIHRGWCTDCRSSTCLLPPDAKGSNTTEEMWAKYIKDVTNCSDSDPLWRKGSDVYNAHFNANPPPVASKLSTMNHMVTINVGSPVEASKANVPSSIRSSILNCSSRWNTVVNILAFDFWSISNPLATIEAMNQNLVRYGQRYSFKDQWALMYFGYSDVHDPLDP